MKIMIRRKLSIHFSRFKMVWLLLIFVVLPIALISRLNELETAGDSIFAKP